MDINPMDLHSTVLDEDYTDETESEDTAFEDDGDIGFSCSRCGAVIRVDSSILVNGCIYCGNKLNLEEAVHYSNSMVLPFSKLPKDVIREFKKKIRFNPFVPFSLRSRRASRNIKKVYLACILSDYDVSGNIIFLGADKIQNVKNAPMQKFESKYSTEFHFHNILISKFPKLSDDIISLINDYDFSSIQPFDNNLVAGSYILDGLVVEENVRKDLEEKVLKHATSIVRGNVNHNMRKVGQNDLLVDASSVRTVLVPIYLLNIKNKGNDTLFVVNGQTGESYVDLPISIISVMVYGFIVFGIIFFITFLLTRFI